MTKSRSRSPRWKPRPPPQRSPECNRHNYYHNNDDFHRDSRRSAHWKDEQPWQDNPRTDSYNHFSDNLYEQRSYVSNPRRSPFEAINRQRRAYSSERREENIRRFPTKNSDYREDNRHFHNIRNHERNVNNNIVHSNGFKAERREDNFHRPYNRDHIKDWHESDVHWNQHDQANQYLSSHRRRPEEHERKSFQKRYPEDDYREHEPAHKRAREAERHDFRPPLRSSHWKNEHQERPHYTKDWSKDIDHRDPTPFAHEKHSGALTKIEYDYSHRSPADRFTKPNLEDEHAKRYNHAEKYNRHDEKKTGFTRSFQHHKTLNNDTRERRRYDDKSSTPVSKYSSKKHDDNTISKNDNDVKHTSHKYKERARKEDYQKKQEDEYFKDANSPNHLRSQSSQIPDPKGVLKVSYEKESLVVNLALKKSTDKYRQPHEQRDKPRHLPPPSNAVQGQELSEENQISDNSMQKRGNSTSKDRQLSQDLVVAGKETFHPVFEHLESSQQASTNAPNSECTQEIITIIHEVKANHFRSVGMSLHERFTKLQAESNKQEVNVEKPIPQTNPEIHRRIDISLEELQSKSLHKTVEVTPASHKVIEDPNDLRHDIERRRKQRLHSEQNGTTDANYGDRDTSSSYYALPHQETGEFQSLSRVSRPPFRKATGRPPVRGTYYRGNSNQYYTSRNTIEDTDESRTPYKGWGNPAARI